MKRTDLVLLAVLYLLLLGFTLAMEWLGIREPAMRTTANLATLGMSAVGGALLALVYRGGKRAEEQPAPEEETKEDPVFDKDAYLAFAAAHGFTRRETEVGLLVANGCSNLRIAEELYISETTVKKHITHIYEKSGIQGRKAFAGEFCANGGKNSEDTLE